MSLGRMTGQQFVMKKDLYKILPIIHVLFKTGCLFSFLLLAPALISYLYLDGLFYRHLITFVIMLLFSILGWFITKPFQRELYPRDGFTLVFLLWLGFALLAAIPLLVSIPNISFTDAYFEAMSGLTTTGTTIIPNIDVLAPSINFWRHMLNWLGGMGIIVLAVAILPMLGVGGMQLFKAEVSGLNKGRKLAPRITQTAKRLWGIYILFTTIVVLALKYIGGMTWFDSVCHAMSSISLGGFSTHGESIAYFNSITIEIILIISMILGAINFINHYHVLTERKLSYYWKDEEFRASFWILLCSIIFVSIYLFFHMDYSYGTSLRYTLFNFVSIGLASGYVNVDFNHWPLMASLWMLLLANILANSGSTGGGIKTIRFLVLFKFLMRELLFAIHPNAVKTVKVNGIVIPDKTALTVLAFIFAYFMTVVIFTFLMMLSGLDFISALSMIVSCITNAGPGLGATGPYADISQLSSIQKWLSCFVMLVGRLEVFTVFILFTPAYWKK